MILGISGKAGAGKDEVASILCKEFRFVRVSLADPLKRFAQEVFQFSDAQLWGPSEMRNMVDARYPRGLSGKFGWVCHSCKVAMHGEAPIEEKTPGRIIGSKVPCVVCKEVPADDKWHYIETPAFLTPRYALQQLGTQWGRDCYENVWIEYAVRVADQLEKGGYAYDNKRGLFPTSSSDFMSPKTDVAIPDVRFKNEIEGLKKAGAVLIRVKRPVAGLEGAAGTHRSETEQDDIHDTDFDFVINNEGTLAELHLMVKEVMRTLKGEVEGAQRADEFLAVITNMNVEYPKDSGVVVEELDLECTPYVPVLPGRLSADGDETVEMDLSGSGLLAELQRQREEDIKAGKLLEYDDAQKDIPPFMRTKKS
jgi:hypothetical protein